VVHCQLTCWCVHSGGGWCENKPTVFHKGTPTEKVWYYDLSDIKVGKKTPFTLNKFEDFFGLLPSRR
jgi:type I restriction enzyme M protein